MATQSCGTVYLVEHYVNGNFVGHLSIWENKADAKNEAKKLNDGALGEKHIVQAHHVLKDA